VAPDFVLTAHRYQRGGETIVRCAMPQLKPFALSPGALRRSSLCAPGRGFDPERQGVIFRYRARLMMVIPGAALPVLRAFMECPDTARMHLPNP
jgi:hypothetical protein